MIPMPKVIRDYIQNHRKTHQRVEYPLATNQEVVAADICAQLGHLSETAKLEIVKLVVSRTLPKMCIGYKPYQRNPKQEAA